MLSLRRTAQALRPHVRGAQVDLVGEVRVGEELVWDGVSTYLDRGASAPVELAPVVLAEQPVTVDVGSDARATAAWHVASDMGRRYAGVSGDVNPMHPELVGSKGLWLPLHLGARHVDEGPCAGCHRRSTTRVVCRGRRLQQTVASAICSQFRCGATE